MMTSRFFDVLGTIYPKTQRLFSLDSNPFPCLFFILVGYAKEASFFFLCLLILAKTSGLILVKFSFTEPVLH